MLSLGPRAPRLECPPFMLPNFEGESSLRVGRVSLESDAACTAFSPSRTPGAAAVPLADVPVWGRFKSVGPELDHAGVTINCPQIDRT